MRFTRTCGKALLGLLGALVLLAALSGGNTVHAVNPPTITSIKLNTGSTAGGSPAAIHGTAFKGATTVSFGGTPASTFTVASNTRIDAIAPAGTGTVLVTVTTPGGTSTPATAGANNFTYYPPDFSLDVTPFTVNEAVASDNGTYTVTLKSVRGFNAAVTLNVSTPSDCDCSGIFNPTSVMPSAGGATSTLTIQTGASSGTFVLTVTGTGGSETHTDTMVLNIS